MLKVDLHVHTKFSDGNLDLDELLTMAKIQGINEISITDHDTIINLENYKSIMKKYNLTIIPGIEIAVNVPGLHILGYGISDFDKIEKKLYKLKLYNEEQNKETIRILQKQGINIMFDDVKRETISGVVTYRDIVSFLIKGGYARDWLEVYEKYIGKGTKAYVPSKKLKMEETIQLIDECKGISVLAHPFTLKSDTDFNFLLPQMKECGLSGIESYSPKINENQNDFYRYLAKKYNLIETGGTDFHNSSTDTLGIDLDEKIIEKLHEKILTKHK